MKKKLESNKTIEKKQKACLSVNGNMVFQTYETLIFSFFCLLCRFGFSHLALFMSMHCCAPLQSFPGSDMESTSTVLLGNHWRVGCGQKIKNSWYGVSHDMPCS